MNPNSHNNSITVNSITINAANGAIPIYHKCVKCQYDKLISPIWILSHPVCLPCSDREYIPEPLSPAPSPWNYPPGVVLALQPSLPYNLICTDRLGKLRTDSEADFQAVAWPAAQASEFLDNDQS